MFTDLSGNLFQGGKDSFFSFSGNTLSGKLIEISRRITAFPIKTSDGTGEFFRSVFYCLHLTGNGKTGEMKDQGCVHTGSRIGGGSGKITRRRIIRIFCSCGNKVIKSIESFPEFRKTHSGSEGLKTQVIFLIEHDKCSVLRIGKQCCAGAGT